MCRWNVKLSASTYHNLTCTVRTLLKMNVSKFVFHLQTCIAPYCSGEKNGSVISLPSFLPLSWGQYSLQIGVLAGTSNRKDSSGLESERSNVHIGWNSHCHTLSVFCIIFIKVVRLLRYDFRWTDLQVKLFCPSYHWCEQWKHAFHHFQPCIITVQFFSLAVMRRCLFGSYK